MFLTFSQNQNGFGDQNSNSHQDFGEFVSDQIKRKDKMK